MTDHRDRFLPDGGYWSCTQPERRPSLPRRDWYWWDCQACAIGYQAANGHPYPENLNGEFLLGVRGEGIW